MKKKQLDPVKQKQEIVIAVSHGSLNMHRRVSNVLSSCGLCWLSLSPQQLFYTLLINVSWFSLLFWQQDTLEEIRKKDEKTRGFLPVWGKGVVVILTYISIASTMAFCFNFLLVLALLELPYCKLQRYP